MQYGMLYRLLDTELKLSTHNQRTDLIPFARQEMDRLFVHSSLVPKIIIDKYIREFPNVSHRPELCDDTMGVPPNCYTPSNDSLANILKSSFNFKRQKTSFDVSRNPPHIITQFGTGASALASPLASPISVILEHDELNAIKVDQDAKTSSSNSTDDSQGDEQVTSS
jgi:hypothetical protein